MCACAHVCVVFCVLCFTYNNCTTLLRKLFHCVSVTAFWSLVYVTGETCGAWVGTISWFSKVVLFVVFVYIAYTSFLRGAGECEWFFPTVKTYVCSSIDFCAVTVNENWQKFDFKFIFTIRYWYRCSGLSFIV